MDNKIQKIRKCVKDTRKENATIADTRGVKKKEKREKKTITLGGPNLSLQKVAITATALICPSAAGSRWQGSPDICVEMVKPIITTLRLLWIPLDVHLSSAKAIS